MCCVCLSVCPSVCPLHAEQLKFTHVPENVTLQLGSADGIECRADGKTRPRVRWYRADDAGGRRTVLAERVTQTHDGQLYFSVVESADAGLYTCLATSEQGTINATVRVDVVGELHVCQCLAAWLSWQRRINEVNQRRARLVLGWVTVCRRVNHLGM